MRIAGEELLEIAKLMEFFHEITPTGLILEEHYRIVNDRAELTLCRSKALWDGLILGGRMNTARIGYS